MGLYVRPKRVFRTCNWSSCACRRRKSFCSLFISDGASKARQEFRSRWCGVLSYAETGVVCRETCNLCMAWRSSSISVECAGVLLGVGVLSWVNWLRSSCISLLAQIESLSSATSFLRPASCEVSEVSLLTAFFGLAIVTAFSVNFGEQRIT